MERKRFCPACHAEIEEDFTFCDKCGAPLPVQEGKAKQPETSGNPESNDAQAVAAEPVINEPDEKICPSCKASVKGTFRFCDKCGADLMASHTDMPPKKAAPETKRIYDDSLPASRPSSRFCPACKLALAPGVTVCPRCGRPVASARQRTNKMTHFRTLSIVAYCLAGFAFFIGFINLISVLLSQYRVFGNVSSASLFAGMTSCLFMGITSLILTVLGSTFLLLFKSKGKQ